MCSASVLNSANLSVVYTAGHCVANGGQQYFYTDFLFCPAYLDGVCQLGQWTIRGLWTATDWYNTGRFQSDLGALVMSTDATATPIVSAVGGQGFAWNQSRFQHWIDLGYPQAAPFDGNRLQLCAASWWRDDNPSPGGTPFDIGIGCDMTGGSSGGGWFIGWGGGGGYRNGHNDYKYGSQPLAMYSPYYGDLAFQIFDLAQTTP